MFKKIESILFVIFFPKTRCTHPILIPITPILVFPSINHCYYTPWKHINHTCIYKNILPCTQIYPFIILLHNTELMHWPLRRWRRRQRKSQTVINIITGTRLKLTRILDNRISTRISRLIFRPIQLIFKALQCFKILLQIFFGVSFFRRFSIRDTSSFLYTYSEVKSITIYHTIHSFYIKSIIWHNT